ncbi:MAG: single-stranded-DNA-specific exonuclease RecJ [Firmicutes bacterium]|nr:single-stranded-DNA-specific exonuclease RecJ [Bacillota bacterium]
MRPAQTIVEQILSGRGLDDPAVREEYLSPHPKATYDPFLMLGMEEGVDLIRSHAEKGNRICVYGDYDADGVTSICILYSVLSLLTDNLDWYIPSRFTEGYGLNEGAVEALKEKGTDLLITVDCGITSLKEVERARQLGMDVLVTDHHQPGPELPDCVVIDPKQEGETYPFPHLAGCGVAFKILQALQRKCGLPRDVISQALDLVGAGTVGDIVPLVDENRTIVKYGLEKLNQGNRASVRALAEAISLEKITSDSIAFGIVPHINAAGRMGSAGDAVNLLMADEEEEIRRQVDRLVQYNRERKKAQEEAVDRCEAMVRGGEDILFLRVDGIHEGIAGIAAGKLKEEIRRPVILATPSGDGLLKGTGRSIPGVDIRALLDVSREHFLKFGGHAGACGFTMREEEFEPVKTAAEADMARLLTEHPEIIEAGSEAEITLEPAEITVDLAQALCAMEPFGEGNPAPRIALKNVQIAQVRFMGAQQTHVRFMAVRGGAAAPCVFFRRAQDYADLLNSGGPADLVGTVSGQVWNGRTRVQFMVEDIQRASK